jgi:hypothetical protein
MIWAASAVIDAVTLFPILRSSAAGCSLATRRFDAVGISAASGTKRTSSESGQMSAVGADIRLLPRIRVIGRT